MDNTSFLEFLEGSGVEDTISNNLNPIFGQSAISLLSIYNGITCLTCKNYICISEDTMQLHYSKTHKNIKYTNLQKGPPATMPFYQALVQRFNNQTSYFEVVSSNIPEDYNLFNIVFKEFIKHRPNEDLPTIHSNRDVTPLMWVTG